MGYVPEWDEYHGWHEFNPEGSLNSPIWCSICDCTEDVHVSKEQYESQKAKEQ
jgi:hypothetical protein